MKDNTFRKLCNINSLLEDGAEKFLNGDGTRNCRLDWSVYDDTAYLHPLTEILSGRISGVANQYTPLKKATEIKAQFRRRASVVVN